MSRLHIILAAFLKAVAAAPSASWPAGSRHYKPALRRHSFLEGPKARCMDTRDFTNCDFDQQLGTGCCPKADLYKIHQAMQGRALATQAIRDLSPQPHLSFPAPQFSAQLYSLQHDAPPAHWKAVDASGQGVLYVIDNFLAPREAEALIAYANHQGSPSQSGMDCGPTRHCEFRKSNSWGLRHAATEEIAPQLTARMAEVAHARVDMFEHMQVTKYLPGDFYSDHNDEEPCDQQLLTMSDAAKTGAPIPKCDSLSRRATTVLIYLNDVTDGGGSTYFPKLNVRVAPKRGTAIVFHPTLKNGWSNPLLLHGSEEVRGSKKYVIQQWIGRSDTV